MLHVAAVNCNFVVLHSFAIFGGKIDLAQMSHVCFGRIYLLLAWELPENQFSETNKGIREKFSFESRKQSSSFWVCISQELFANSELKILQKFQTDKSLQNVVPSSICMRPHILLRKWNLWDIFKNCGSVAQSARSRCKSSEDTVSPRSLL